MQAIIIKYVSPTTTKMARWKATAATGSITVNYDSALNERDNVKAAVKALLVKLNWTKAHGYACNWMVGELPNGDWSAVYAGVATAVFMAE